VETNPREPDRRKLRWLVIGFICYYFLLLYAFRYARALPYQVVVLSAVLNFAIMGAFILSIRKVYLRINGLTLPKGVEVDEATAKLRLDFDRRRLKWLWVGAGLYSLTFLNGLRLGLVYAGRLSLLGIILAEAFNGLILAVFILEIRKVYQRLESGNSRPS